MKVPKLYAVDVGYGYVKTPKQPPFSSIVAKTTLESFLNAQDEIDSLNPFLLSYNDDIYALGATASQITRNPLTVMEGTKRWESDTYLALMLGGVARQMPKGNINEDIMLVTGLPYLQSKNSAELEGIKNSFTKKFKVEILEENKPVTKIMNIVDVQVLSQPRGAYYALLSLTNKTIKTQLALIADLGFKSLDYLVTSNGQETLESNGEDSIAGMERIYTSLIRELRSKGLPPVKPYELDYWLEKGYLSNYTRDIEKHLERASQEVINDIKEKLGASWNRIEMIGSIYFVGGSSKRLQKYFRKELNMPNVYFTENSQQLIVEGYGAYGRAIMRKVYGGIVYG